MLTGMHFVRLNLASSETFVAKVWQRVVGVVVNLHWANTKRPVSS